MNYEKMMEVAGLPMINEATTSKVYRNTDLANLKKRLVKAKVDIRGLSDDQIIQFANAMDYITHYDIKDVK